MGVNLSEIKEMVEKDLELNDTELDLESLID